jgi:hypothetical protein
MIGRPDARAGRRFSRADRSAALRRRAGLRYSLIADDCSWMAAHVSVLRVVTMPISPDQFMCAPDSRLR